MRAQIVKIGIGTATVRTAPVFRSQTPHSDRQLVGRQRLCLRDWLAVSQSLDGVPTQCTRTSSVFARAERDTGLFEAMRDCRKFSLGSY